ncbi:hypothetical protein F5890DRAFT_1553407 [Lentinula detonsa]|uniref:Uncharacterized protein n=1 Tax=Lentinula detonsa TaxID=2804962 RepID=A0AA38Q1E6_9AGAR|nr:hypothetical protein F5890DRAFT_1553407 [Lentinula detonsa]
MVKVSSPTTDLEILIVRDGGSCAWPAFNVQASETKLVQTSALHAIKGEETSLKKTSELQLFSEFVHIQPSHFDLKLIPKQWIPSPNAPSSTPPPPPPPPLGPTFAFSLPRCLPTLPRRIHRTKPHRCLLMKKTLALDVDLGTLTAYLTTNRSSGTPITYLSSAFLCAFLFIRPFERSIFLTFHCLDLNYSSPTLSFGRRFIFSFTTQEFIQESVVGTTSILLMFATKRNESYDFTPRL